MLGEAIFPLSCFGALYLRGRWAFGLRRAKTSHKWNHYAQSRAVSSGRLTSCRPCYFHSICSVLKENPEKEKHKQIAALLQGKWPSVPTSGSCRSHTQEWSLFAWKLKTLSAPLLPSSLNGLVGEEKLCHHPQFPRYKANWL